MKRFLASLGSALVFLTVAAPAQTKADQAAFDARLGNAHFYIDGDNYLVIYNDGAPTKINFEEVGGFNWFNQNGEYFADIILRHNRPKTAEQLKQVTLEDQLEIGVESAGPSIEAHYIPGFVGDPPNRVMYYQTPNGPGGYSGEYYVLQMSKEGDSAVTQVLELTDTNLKLRIKGTGTLGERRDHGESTVQFETVINLKRTPFVRLPLSQVFGEACDPTFYDKTAGAEYRSVTDCEIKFERHVRHGYTDALQPTIEEFEKMGWNIFKQPSMEPRTDRGGMSRSRHQTPLVIGGQLDLELDRRSNEEEAVYKKKRQQEVLSRYSMDRQVKELMAVQQEIKANDVINISLATNPAVEAADAISYRKPLTTYPIAGGGLAFGTNDADDDEEGQTRLSPNKTLLYLGPIKQTTVKNSDGSSTVNIRPVFDAKAPLTAAQVIEITIECKPELAAAVIAKLDIHKLQDLVYKGSQ
jgi:hypothetical protein